MSEEKKVTIAEMFTDKEDFNNLMDSFDKYQQKADGRDIKKICDKNKKHLESLGINHNFLPFYLMKKIIDKAIDDAEKRNKAVEEAEQLVKDFSGNVVDVSGDVVDVSGDVVDVSGDVVEDISGCVVEDIAGNVIEVKEDISGNFEKDLSNNITLNINNDKETQTEEEETKTETPTPSIPESDPEADNNC